MLVEQTNDDIPPVSLSKVIRPSEVILMVMFMAWVWVSAIVMVGQTYIPISISKSELCIFVAPG